MRRKLQRIDKRRLLFLDETALRLNAAPTHTIVLPGEQAYVVATETSAYAKRYDMIACCVGDRVCKRARLALLTSETKGAK